MGKLFLIFLSNSNPQMQSDFSFKSKTPFGKSLIMKAFFKGLWQRTHEKMGEKSLSCRRIALHHNNPLAACAHPGLWGWCFTPPPRPPPQNNVCLRLLPFPCSPLPSHKEWTHLHNKYLIDKLLPPHIPPPGPGAAAGTPPPARADKVLITWVKEDKEISPGSQA